MPRKSTSKQLRSQKRKKRSLPKQSIIPQLYINVGTGRGRYGWGSFSRAYLLEKRGALVLQWREGGKVCNRYLGKASRRFYSDQRDPVS